MHWKRLTVKYENIRRMLQTGKLTTTRCCWVGRSEWNISHPHYKKNLVNLQVNKRASFKWDVFFRGHKYYLIQSQLTQTLDILKEGQPLCSLTPEWIGWRGSSNCLDTGGSQETKTLGTRQSLSPPPSLLFSLPCPLPAHSSTAQEPACVLMLNVDGSHQVYCLAPLVLKLQVTDPCQDFISLFIEEKY